MTNSPQWKQIWESNSKGGVSDFELDRGISPRDQEIERLSEREHIDFIDPQSSEVVLDAGCGTGVNVLRLRSHVRSIIGIDYASGSLVRCHKKILAEQIQNAQICSASITAIPLRDKSVNKILCFSVLQYLNDDEFRQALKEFVRIGAPGGTIVLHVKNASSVYWSTLSLAKMLKARLGRTTQSYYVRPFQWYIDQLRSHHCRIVECRSFNLLSVDKMPGWLLRSLQRMELRQQSGLLRIPYLRRHGADLKIKAIIEPAVQESPQTNPDTVPQESKTVLAS